MAFASTINLTIITMMIIIYLNEMRNISMFIFNFNYIKDLARITMDEKCNGIYCEAETDRYQIAKNSYNLLMPNDVFNSKTYTIFVFIISIMILIYYYRMLINFKDNPKTSITITLSFFIILIIIIGVRYVPNDEQGYKNYYKNVYLTGTNAHRDAIALVVTLIVFIIVLLVIQVLYTKGKMNVPESWTLYFWVWSWKNILNWNWNFMNWTWLIDAINILFKEGFIELIIEFIKLTCFFISITLVFNLMNIVMTFRKNTTPILKTVPLSWSLQNSFNSQLNFRLTGVTDNELISSYAAKEMNNISNFLNIYLAFEEYSKVKTKGFTSDYTKLKKIVDITTDDNTRQNTCELSLIFDKSVYIPRDYGDPIFDKDSSKSHYVNSNDRNTDYEYTADISYDNANVFYEKYWDMRSNDDPDGNFLDKYFYFVPTNLNLYKGANLYRFMTDVLYFIGIVVVVVLIIFISRGDLDYVYILYEILFPLIAFVVFVTYIIVFIRFNTNFNKNVVYKCLDCSYKRALNKLNTIVSPYIRMYDNKITGGNKNYTHHYIIANVFYSILSGNINLSAIASSPIINENVDGTSYFTISNGLKEVDINTINNLNNENQFREYYKERFKNLYNTIYDDKEVKKIYTVFTNLFVTTTIAKTTGELIESYFKSDIIKYDLILKIYRIIKICIKLFDEKTFNNSDKDNYKDFIFYKKSSKLIPHKFILILRSISDYNTFVNKHETYNTYINEFNYAFNKENVYRIDIIVDADHSKNTNVDMTSILVDINNEDSTNQNPDIQNKNMIKIIAKYLLIMGHMNYNGFDYRVADITEITKKDIYTLQTLNLYELISNVSYVDTFDIDDTFGKTNKITDNRYKKLTYMYNYLDTKYVILSSNNNKNYLLNIIKSINNTLNNDNKTTQPDNFKDIKEAQYLFRGKINEIAPELPYENEDEILNKAHYISTTSFESTYFVNMFIIISYIIGTIVFKIK